ncbi:MAG: hypothetical protein HY274_05010 [Gammaproteobacteria bacterium]|nr:hypothetical protein [Gammaproteobacteria bacterium]
MPDNSVSLSIDTATDSRHLTRCRENPPVQAVNQLKTGEWLEMIANRSRFGEGRAGLEPADRPTLVESRQDSEKYKFIVEKAA